MGVYSIGVDIVDIDRFTGIIDKKNQRFIKRVFTSAEIEYCSQKVTHAASYAARFAAKEAVFKAAGTGLNDGMTWKDVEVMIDGQGKPHINLSGKTAKLLLNKRVMVSLSHAGNMAIAMVVVEDGQELT